MIEIPKILQYARVDVADHVEYSPEKSAFCATVALSQNKLQLKHF